MSLVQRLGIAAFVVIITGVGLSPAVEAHSAHQDHHQHSGKNKKKKAYNRGYKHGYRRAIENIYRPYYRSYSPLYGPLASPMPRRLIFTPTPWMVPLHPHHHGTRIKVGQGFHL